MEKVNMVICNAPKDAPKTCNDDRQLVIKQSNSVIQAPLHTVLSFPVIVPQNSDMAPMILLRNCSVTARWDIIKSIAIYSR